ncbi:MAG: hypothetical protein ABIS50_09680 [Luteolibacter sp.]|uniref:hypothetical protein n=1 Tax=Luteolibacter sp. TaxID=1962973 RepID=UPI0032649334
MRNLLLAILMLLPALLDAQNARPVRCRFLSFGGTGPAMSAIAVSDKGTEITCPLSSSQLSPQIVCFSKNNTIPFLSSGDKKPLASASIPAGVNAALLVFVQTPKKAEAASLSDWKVLVIEDSPKNFPDGGAFVANFYNNDIRFVIGEHKGMLHAGGSFGYAKPEERDSFNMAPVVFEFIQEDKWHIANESALRFLPGMRYLIFAYVDPASGRPKINTYQDFATPAVTPAAP